MATARLPSLTASIMAEWAWIVSESVDKGWKREAEVLLQRTSVAVAVLSLKAGTCLQ